MLQSWEAARAAALHDERLLTEAFLPAVRSQLLSAYGWYLLSVSGLEESSLATPPQATSELAPPELGKALAPELREFSALEQRGWLADLLTPPEEYLAAARGGGRKGLGTDMLVTDQSAPGYAVVHGWERELKTLMTRMDDSLQES